MKQLFEDRERPLYGSAVPLRLGRLADQDIAAYVVERFRQTDRGVGDALNPLLAAAQGHPQRSMLLAHVLWKHVPRRKEATPDDWATAHEEALHELHFEFDAMWRGLDSSERKTLRAIVAGDGSPYRVQVLQRLDLTKTMAQKALARLAATATMGPDGRRQRIVDPLFAEWIDRLKDDPGSVAG